MDKLKNKIITGGFSLIELTVTIGIFLIISSVLIFNYSDFRNRMSLSKEVANIVSDIRTAQVYSLGTRQYGGFGIDDIKGYGVYFKIDTPINQKKYQIFLDLNSPSNKIYDAGTEEVGSAIQIMTTNKISSLTCVDFLGNSSSCTEVNIFYSRPYVNAFISNNDGSYDYVEIEVQSTSNVSLKKTIKVHKTTGYVEIY